MTNTPNILITTEYDATEVTPSLGQYSNGRLAISFVCDEGPYGHLTVNLPNEHLNEGEFFVKEYAENGDLAMALISEGWIEYQGREVQAGFTIVPVAKAAGPLLTYINSL